MLKSWGLPSVPVSVLFWAMAAAASGCTALSSGERGVELGHGALAVELALAADSDIETLFYRIDRNAVTERSGSLAVAPGSRSVEFFIGGLPAGSGYTLTLSGVSRDGKLRCAGQRTFEVTAGSSAQLRVDINCRGERKNGGIRVDGTLNVCPEIGVTTAVPGFDNALDIVALASDAEGDPLSYSWSTLVGTFSAPYAPHTSYACAAEGKYPLTLSVSDGMCTESSVIAVPCRSPVAIAWARRGGGAARDAAQAVAPLADGSLLVAGQFDGEASFGDAALSAAVPSIFLARYTSDGALSWIRNAGAGEHCSVATTVSGGFVAATTRADTFLSRYQADGSLLWTRRAAGAITQVAIAALDDGTVYATGSFSGLVVFESAVLQTATTAAFLVRYNADGSVAWAQKSEAAAGRALTPLADGALYVTGTFRDTADFAGTSLTARGESDLFLAKYRADGNLAWVRQAGGAEHDESTSVAALADGSLFVAGQFSGNAVFGDTVLRSSGNHSLFLARYTADGTSVWAQQAAITGVAGAGQVAARADGSAYMAGFFLGTASFGATTLSAVDDYSKLFLARYRADGVLTWVRHSGESNRDFASAVAVQADGSAYVAGGLEGAGVFGNTTLTSSGLSDSLVVKFKP